MPTNPSWTFEFDSPTPVPSPLETLQMFFNYAPDELHRVGVDPATSEGKQEIKEALLEALVYLQDANVPGSERTMGIVRALLSEGP